MILVAGGTGSLGGRIANELIERGDTVRLLARPTSLYQPLERKGAQVAIGDLRDPDSLARACVGVDAIICTASATKRADDTIENVDLDGTQNLIHAAERADVEHFIFVSTNAAMLGSHVPVFHAKAVVEERLRGSSMAYTILRPDAFMDVWFGMMIELALFTGQAVTLVGGAQRRHTFIAEQDVAAFALAAVREPAARNATLDLGGPEAITFRDVVHAYEQAVGHSIAVRNVNVGEPIPGVPEPVWSIVAGLESIDTDVPMAENCRRFNVRLTSAQAFARARVEAAQIVARQQPPLR